MGFWQFCEKVSGFVGTNTARENIEIIWRCWVDGKTVGECEQIIKTKKVAH